ncbi:MAG: HDOD domain-containing protein [bacterium]|nr:HDOD domain-containing protein [bacterium]
MTNTATDTKELIDSELQKRIDGIEGLPAIPEIYNELVAELSSEDVSMQKIASIVSKDIAISAKLLQVVKSAYFGVRTEIQSVQQAVNQLGVDTVKGVILSAGVYADSNCDPVAGFSPAGLYRTAAAVGPKARFIAHAFGLARNKADEALTAGMMHDVGKLVLLAGFVAEIKQAVEISRQEQIPFHHAIEKTLGVNDAVLGASLLSSWGFPESIVEAVCFHYEPSKKRSPMPNATTAVHLAYASEHDQNSNLSDSEPTAFDLQYTDSLGITSQLEQFKGLTAESVMQF